MSNTNRATTGADGPYWLALSEGYLALPRCTACGQWHWPAVWRCGECRSWDIAWQQVPLEGTVFSWVRTWHQFDGTEGIDVPFVSLLIELPHAGGRRVLGLLTGDHKAVRIGAKVRGRVATTRVGQEDVPALHWQISEEATS